MIGEGQGNVSLDSLLDTMTNVVGILVILLVVTQFGVRDAIWRIQWKMSDVGPKQLADLKGRTENKRAMVAELQSEWDVRAERAEINITELERARERVALLDEQLRVQKARQGRKAESEKGR